MGKAEVHIDTKKFSVELGKWINDRAREIAMQIAKDARRWGKQHKLSGNYSKGIRVKKSKFEDGGYIVKATAPHSFLIEFGTKGNRVATSKAEKTEPGGTWTFKNPRTGEYWTVQKVDPMPALAPLRTALKNNIEYARQQFLTKQHKPFRDMWE